MRRLGSIADRQRIFANSEFSSCAVRATEYGERIECKWDDLYYLKAFGPSRGAKASYQLAGACKDTETRAKGGRAPKGGARPYKQGYCTSPFLKATKGPAHPVLAGKEEVPMRDLIDLVRRWVKAVRGWNWAKSLVKPATLKTLMWVLVWTMRVVGALHTLIRVFRE